LAVITVWVDPTKADDSGDGLSFANAKKTIPAGLTVLDTGDANSVLNLVNTGTHDWPTSQTDLTGLNGTDYVSDPGCTIRGTDSGGVPAFTTIAPADGDGDVARLMLRLSGAATNYVVMRNLLFDASGRASDISSYNIVVANNNNGAGPIQFEEVAVIGSATGVVCAGERALFEASGTQPNDAFSMKYVYFQNARNPIGSSSGYGGATIKAAMQNCVGIWDNDDRATAWFNQGSWTGAALNSVKMINCTFYESAGASDIVSVIHYAPNAVDVDTIEVHSNLVWVETTSTTVNPFMRGGTAGATATTSKIIDSNVLIGGPSVGAGDLTAAEWYQVPWDANDDDAVAPDTQPLDTVVYGEADTLAFNDPASTFAWEMPSGLTITILKDLRPIKYQTAGRFGATPGALPQASTSGTDSGGGDPDNPATIPFLDVVPFYAAVLQYSLNSRFSTEKNRVRRNYVRKDIELKGFREWATRRIQVDTSTTDEIITGIETAELVFLESDEAVQLNVGQVADVFLPDAKVVLVAGGEYSVIKVKNDSATDDALTLITVVD
jgi:hypothetical protein